MTETAIVDERDITSPVNWVMIQRAKVAIEALKRHHLNAHYVPNGGAALTTIMGMIPDGASVFRADSVTLDQIGFVPAIRSRNTNKLMYPQEKDGNGHSLYGDYEANKELYAKMQREAFSADVFLCGANAITMDGKIISTDGGGNRVAPMIFGPTKVIVVVGVNKVVKDRDAAFARIRDFCAPVNVKRHFDMHHRPWYGEIPCATTGICTDCDHPRRICNFTGIIESQLPRFKDRIHVVVIGEDLGM